MTIHNEVFEAQAGRLLSVNPFALDQHEAVGCTDPTHACTWYRDVFGQPWPYGSGTLTAGQKLAHIRLHQMLAAGDFGIGVVQIGTRPGADADVAGNQGRLDAGIAESGWSDPDVLATGSGPLRAVFSPDVGRGAECDGHVQLPAGFDIRVHATPAGPGDVDVPLDGRRLTLPLEVGTTDASRTWLHLIQDGGVVRWPYGMDALVVLATTRDLQRDILSAGPLF